MQTEYLETLFRTSGLQHDDVHVWCISLTVMHDHLHDLRNLLDREERERAERFAVEGARHQYIVGRSCLRLILGNYLQESPGKLRFIYGPHGKPELADFGDLKFSVSHSADRVLVAVTLDGSIGVDVENIRGDMELAEIATQCFSPTEILRLYESPDSDRTREFFRYWTSKEALVKAVGAGLSIPLDSIEVGIRGGDGLTRVCFSRGDELQWWFAYELDVGPGFAATLVLRSDASDVRVLRPQEQ